MFLNRAPDGRVSAVYNKQFQQKIKDKQRIYLCVSPDP